MSNQVVEIKDHASVSDISQIDHLSSTFRKLMSDVRGDVKRIKGAKPTIDLVYSEISGTVLPYVRDLASGFSDLIGNIRVLWEVLTALQQWADVTSDHLEALEDRVGMLEDYGTSTTILPDDFEVLQDVINGIDLTAKKLLAGPFPITPPDENGKKALANLIAMASNARKIIERGRVDIDDLDDELDDDEMDDEIEKATSKDKPSDEPN